MTRISSFLAVLLLAAPADVAGAEAPETVVSSMAVSPACLSGTSASLEEVAEKFLEALLLSDEPALRAMSLSREEFFGAVWPRLPASRTGVAAEWVWGMYEPKNRLAFEALLRRHGGVPYRLREIRFTGQSSDYGAYRVHRRSLLVLEDTKGEERTLRLFGAVLEQNGRFKLYGFVTD